MVCAPPEPRPAAPELAHCQTQLELIRHLGLDVFSQNIYADQQHCWFVGLTE
jgi:hypothetical protein